MNKIHSLVVKNVIVYKQAKVVFGDNDEIVNRFGDIFLDYTVSKFKNMLFNCHKLDEPNYVNGIVHKRYGQGIVTSFIDSDNRKQISLVMYHDNYDACFYQFRIDDKIANVKLTDGIDDIKTYINQFMEMPIPPLTE